MFIRDEEAFDLLIDHKILQGPIHNPMGENQPRWYRWYGKLGPHVTCDGKEICKVKIWDKWSSDPEPTDPKETVRHRA